MELIFWGTRSAIHPGWGARMTRSKVIQALQASQGQRFEDEAQLENFVDSVLPFSIGQGYGHHTSCVQLLGTDTPYLFCDAGSGLAAFSHAYKQRLHASPDQILPEETFHFFLSHLHWDHIQGFLNFLPIYVPGNTIVIHTHHPEAQAAFEAMFNKNCFPLGLQELKAQLMFDIMPLKAPTQLRGLRIQSISQDHPGGSYGYRFEHQGRSFVYSTDAEHREDAVREDYPFVSFFRDADVLVFDAQYSFADALLSKANWGHSNNITAVELAARAGVKHLVLFHNEAEASDEELDQFLFNTRLYADIYEGETLGDPHVSPEAISLAYDGLRLTL